MSTETGELVNLTRISDEEELRELERKYCSWGDTVHYLESPKFFERAEGSYLYDREGTPYLDLQMWYSAASFGYGNQRLNDALTHQLNKLPQLAPQYLHRERVELAAAIARLNASKFGLNGRVHFNVGGSQAIEDSLKIVRNATGKNLVFAFMGGYHGRTLAASAITSSYRYRRRYGHFADRAHFVPFPYCFRCPYGKKKEDCGLYCVQQFEKNFETEYNSFWDAKAGESEFSAFYVEPIQGTGGYVIPPPEYFPALKKVLDDHKVLMVDDEIQMGFYRAGKFWAIENFDVAPDIVVFGKALTNGLNPLSGVWAREELISPEKFPAGSTHSTFASNTLGTALGDFIATDAGLGFERGALLFAGLIAVVAALHFFTKIPGSVLFWAAYVLTRPLGATLGDTLTKPHAEGGLALGRITSSLVIAAAMIVIIAITSRRERLQTA